MSTQATLIPANDPALRYEGRVDARDPEKPVLVWQSTRIVAEFEGTSLALRFGACTGACFFNVDVDGVTKIVEVREGNGTLRSVVADALAPGWHRLTLFKRSEPEAGHVAFLGLELAEGAKVRSAAPETHKVSMQFFGDSITVGACNEDGPEDQWDNRATHNNALSYGALTAREFNADYRNIAVSGMGIVMGYVPVRAGEVWDRLYPKVDAPKADLGAWIPDVVFVNFGENDDSFSKNQGLPFPGEFAAGYVSLVKRMRTAYPRAEIVLLRGGMAGGAQSEPLRLAWESAVGSLKAKDARMHHFVFKHWSLTHPRVSDDRAMAVELSAWLKAQPFMQERL